MPRKSKKEGLVDQLFTYSDIDLIEGTANLIMESDFSVKDCLIYLGDKNLKLFNGFTLTPFNDRLMNIMVGYLYDQKNIISEITFGGNIEYSLEELGEKFGPYRMAYNPRDELTAFLFYKLPKEINAIELNFTHCDLIFDKKTEGIFEQVKGKRNKVAPKDITFQHFTLLF